MSRSRWFDSKDLVIPAVYWDLTTEKLLVLEWLDGKPLLSADLSATANESAKKRREVTTLLFRAFFQQLYIDGFFHADPPSGEFVLSCRRSGSFA